MGGTDIEEAADVKLSFFVPHAIEGPSYILMRLPE